MSEPTINTERIQESTTPCNSIKQNDSFEPNFQTSTRKNDGDINQSKINHKIDTYIKSATDCRRKILNLETCRSHKSGDDWRI
jgi:hypothetical protein